jgi:hypothetical protein
MLCTCKLCIRTGVNDLSGLYNGASPYPSIAEGFPRRLVNFPYELCGKIPGQSSVALRGNKRLRLRSKAGTPHLPLTKAKLHLSF